MAFPTYSCLKYILMTMIKIFQESEVGGWKSILKLAFQALLPCGVLMTCDIFIWCELKWPPGEAAAAPVTPRGVGHFCSWILGAVRFYPSTSPALWSWHPKGYSKGKSHDLFWNSKTFSCCQSWINVSEKTIRARFVKRKKIFFCCCLKTSGKDLLQEEK